MGFLWHKSYVKLKCWSVLSIFISALFCLRNLQAAIGAYYDFESPNISAPCMSFVRDVTIGEGESVPPDTPFTKTWRIQNTGKSSRITVILIWENTELTPDLVKWKIITRMSCWVQHGCLCVFQVQNRGLPGFVWSMLEEISLVM